MADVMTRGALCCHPDTSLHEAAALLWDQDVGALLVIDGTGGEQVRAIITDRDIAMAAYTRAQPLHELQVRDACSGPARACRPDDPVTHALALMAEAAVRRLIVVDAHNHPLGLLSLSDVARAASHQDERRKKLERVVCRTLAAITRSRGEETSPRTSTDPETDRDKVPPHAIPHSFV